MNIKTGLYTDDAFKLLLSLDGRNLKIDLSEAEFQYNKQYNLSVHWLQPCEGAAGKYVFVDIKMFRDSDGNIILDAVDKLDFEKILNKLDDILNNLDEIMLDPVKKEDCRIILKYILGEALESDSESKRLDELVGEPRNPIVATMIEEYYLKLEEELEIQNNEIRKENEKLSHIVDGIRKSHRRTIDELKQKICNLENNKIPKN